MNHDRLTILILLGVLAAGPALAGETTPGTPAATAQLPRGTASGYPPAGGRGPGSGHSYRSATPGYGTRTPQYRNGRGSWTPPVPDTPPPAITPAPVTAPAIDPPPTGIQRSTIPDWRGYRRTQYRDYGRGYGYPGFRGLGGGPYRHHRQFGNPPVFRAPPPRTVPDPADNG